MGAIPGRLDLLEALHEGDDDQPKISEISAKLAAFDAMREALTALYDIAISDAEEKLFPEEFKAARAALELADDCEATP